MSVKNDTHANCYPLTRDLAQEDSGIGNILGDVTTAKVCFRPSVLPNTSPSPLSLKCSVYPL